MIKIIILLIICIFLVFVLKNKNKKDTMPSEILKEASKIAIFSEGEKYWGTFEPVIKVLLEKNCPVRYYTMDKQDPAFLIESDILKVDYIGKNDMAFFRLNSLDALILVSTTPNIGTKGYPVKKSPCVKTLIHIWHSFGEYAYAWYHKYSLDSYDEILTTGEYMEKQIRFIENKRNLPEKKIEICGVPYLDRLYKGEADVEKDNQNKQKTVLVAPSWGNKSLLAYYDVNFIKQLYDDGFKIIFRPHPQSVKFEKQKLEEIQKQLSPCTDIVWDYSENQELSLKQADIMISDTSSVRLDFAVLYNKPVITLETPVSNYDEYEYEDLKELLSDNQMDNELGTYVSLEQADKIAEITKKCFSEKNNERNILINEKYASNLGKAGEKIADYLIKRKQELDN